jgi:hypothetical protein
MPRYIDADRLISRLNIFNEWCKDERLKGSIFAVDVIRDEPTADVEPVKHGKWEKEEICTNCKTNIEDLFEGEFYYSCEKLRFCPHCGAKMDGGDE